MGIRNVHVIDPCADPHGLARLVTESLARAELSVIVARRNCLLAAADIKRYEACPE